MTTRRRAILRRRRGVFLVVDSGERPILLVKVKTGRHDPDQNLLQMIKYISATSIPFVMLVDSEQIKIYRWEKSRLSGPVYSAETASVLRYYSEYFDKFKSAGMEAEYLLVLVQAWLRDLSYRWKSKSADPPGARQFDELGLLPLLKNARVDPEVS